MPNNFLPLSDDDSDQESETIDTLPGATKIFYLLYVSVHKKTTSRAISVYIKRRKTYARISKSL